PPVGGHAPGRSPRAVPRPRPPGRGRRRTRPPGQGPQRAAPAQKEPPTPPSGDLLLAAAPALNRLLRALRVVPFSQDALSLRTLPLRRRRRRRTPPRRWR